MVIAAPTAVHAAQPAALIKGEPKRIQSRPFVKSSTEVGIDLSGPRLGRSAINLKLPDGRTLKLMNKRHKNRRNGDALWVGHVADTADSEVILTVRKGKLAGHIRAGSETWRIRPGKKQQHVIELVDESALPACGTGPEQQISLGSSEQSPVVPLAVATAVGNPVVVQIITVYTPAARAVAGDADAIEAQIQNAADYANNAFAVSDMNVQLDLVHMEEVDYTEQADSYIDLDNIRIDKSIAALRDQYGADMVSAITAQTGLCGLGYLPDQPGQAFDEWAYSLTTFHCLGGYIFAHENGHNLGMMHDRVANGSDSEFAPFPWAFGYFVDGSYRTIMAYASSCAVHCPVAPYFSNPDILFNGIPTGVAESEDNARTGDLIAPINASFRSELSVRVRVSHSIDDVEERLAAGAMYTDSSDMEIGHDGSLEQLIGLRFRGISIPPGANVTRAYLEFVTDEINSDLSEADIFGVAEDDATAFADTDYNLSSRATTPSSVYWDIPPWPNVGESHRSPELAEIVQDIVDRGGWSSGNAMAFVISGSGERTAESFEGSVSEAPLLHVEYIFDTAAVIDVLPNDEANEVYPNQLGNFPVAIMSSPEFDAMQIDPASLSLGAAEAAPVGPVEFVDADGAFGVDMQAQFSMQHTGILCNDNEVSLRGETYGGVTFSGTDLIDATQCETGGCHAY
ncbi:MAG: reprolysin-like metallopeptidase [Gammaproteobacteria bacterium]